MALSTFQIPKTTRHGGPVLLWGVRYGSYPHAQTIQSRCWETLLINEMQQKLLTNSFNCNRTKKTMFETYCVHSPMAFTEKVWFHSYKRNSPEASDLSGQLSRSFCFTKVMQSDHGSLRWGRTLGTTSVEAKKCEWPLGYKQLLSGGVSNIIHINSGYT